MHKDPVKGAEKDTNATTGQGWQDFSRHHQDAAAQHEQASKHHREAARHHEAGKYEVAYFHAHIAHEHTLQAIYYSEEAAKRYANALGTEIMTPDFPCVGGNHQR